MNGVIFVVGPASQTFNVSMFEIGKIHVSCSQHYIRFDPIQFDPIQYMCCVLCALYMLCLIILFVLIEDQHTNAHHIKAKPLGIIE